MADIFISYHRTDKAFASDLYSELRRFNVRGFMDHSDVAAGEDFSRQLKDAIRTTDALVVVLSTAAAQSSYVLAEIGMAQGLAKSILPILAPGERYDESVPPLLLDSPVIDANVSSTEEVAAKIVAAVTKTSVNQALNQVQSGARRRQRRLMLIAAALGILSVVSMLSAAAAIWQRDNAIAALRTAEIARSDAENAQREAEAALKQVDVAAKALSDLELQSKEEIDRAKIECARTNTPCQTLVSIAAKFQAIAASGSQSIDAGLMAQGSLPSNQSSGNIEGLREQLSGSSRRKVSDDLAIKYASNKDSARQVISSLATAALPESERNAYRVNLYILRTLAKIPGGWSTSVPNDREALLRIANSELLGKDPVYRSWAAQARGNLQP